MTGDLSKFAPSLSQKFGVDLNMAQGGLPTVGKTEEVGGIKVDELPEAIKNLIKARDQLAADEQEMKDNPLVPQTGFTRTTSTPKTPVGRLDDFKPKRDQKPSTTVQQTALDVLAGNREFAEYIIKNIPGLLEQANRNQIEQQKVAGEIALERDTKAEWGAITRAQIARDQALAQSLLTANVLAHTPNMGVIQALNQTAPSVVGAYKMGSPVLGK